MNKLFNYISWVTILSAMTIMVVVAYWLIYPYKTTEFKNLPARVENKKIRAGDDLVYFIDYCKYTDVMPEISKKFVDSIIYSVPTTLSTTKKGCGTNKIQITVPRNLPVGTYYISLTYRYKVNPLRAIDVVIKTEKFQVIK